MRIGSMSVSRMVIAFVGFMRFFCLMPGVVW